MIDEFRKGYDTFSTGFEGRLPLDPEFPAAYLEGKMGLVTVLPDTPFDRAWFAAGNLFDDVAKRVSFYARVERVMKIAIDDRQYAKYVDREVGSFHVALFAAIAAVRFNSRTTAKSLRTAFAVEFRRCWPASRRSAQAKDSRPKGPHQMDRPCAIRWNRDPV